MQKQLTLFDVPASIKPGDRVKLRRKSKNAPLLEEARGSDNTVQLRLK